MPFKRPAYPAHYRLNKPNNPIKRTSTNFLAFLPASAPRPPPYPYGPALWFKQANKGLYGGATRLVGNNVSEKFETKTRRTWYPNVHMKRIYSRALGRWLRLKVTVNTLKTIDKVGGIDEYVLGKTANRVRELGPMGWDLRWVILHTDKVRERMVKDLGLRKMLEGTEDPNFVRRQQESERERGVLEAERAREEEKMDLEEEEYEDYEEDLGPEDARIQVGTRSRVDEGHMAEQPMPPATTSSWQRLKSFATDPLGRRRRS